jgi:hypothetical protein
VLDGLVPRVRTTTVARRPPAPTLRLSPTQVGATGYGMAAIGSF